jgi:hypothetical protein
MFNKIIIPLGMFFFATNLYAASCPAVTDWLPRAAGVEFELAPSAVNKGWRYVTNYPENIVGSYGYGESLSADVVVTLEVQIISGKDNQYAMVCNYSKNGKLPLMIIKNTMTDEDLTKPFPCIPDPKTTHNNNCYCTVTPASPCSWSWIGEQDLPLEYPPE